MAGALSCNGCFQRPRGGAGAGLRLTSCGHLLCPPCLPPAGTPEGAPPGGTDPARPPHGRTLIPPPPAPGQKEECVICRAPCCTIMLSNEMNSDMQALFMGIDGLCRKYSKEVSQISQFQEKHRGHLLTYYKEKITELDRYRKAAQQRQHLHQQQKSYEPVNKGGEVEQLLNRGEYWASRDKRRDPSMEMDYVPPSVRKIETVAQPRISLISPPQNGHMGTIPYRSSRLSGVALCQNGTSASVRSTPLRMPGREAHYMSQIGSSQSNKSSRSDAFGFGTPQHYRNTPASSLPVGTRRPISLADLLQKQHLGSASLGEHILQK
ncbi:putative E3 SUMO-protein ligase RNF212 isoform X2 [Paroedura picta]|uniref:putative E3 SUMO-protein ligase RNF212 isoform X2 n=1 Tax=Paroedura picta TaxID=143630 RepID=UPI004056C7CA